VIDDGNVTRAQPPVGSQRPSGGLRVLEVTLEHIGAPYPDLPRVAVQGVLAVVVDDTYLDTRQDATDRTDLGECGFAIDVSSGSHDRGTLRETIALGHQQSEALEQRPRGVFWHL